jgi:hypothetical protein
LPGMWRPPPREGWPGRVGREDGSSGSWALRIFVALLDGGPVAAPGQKAATGLPRDDGVSEPGTPCIGCGVGCGLGRRRRFSRRRRHVLPAGYGGVGRSPSSRQACPPTTREGLRPVSSLCSMAGHVRRRTRAPGFAGCVAHSVSSRRARREAAFSGAGAPRGSSGLHGRGGDLAPKAEGRVVWQNLLNYMVQLHLSLSNDL